MSHSSKDAVGGHYPARYNSWSKRFNRREARRESKATITEALDLMEADAMDDQRFRDMEDMDYVYGDGLSDQWYDEYLAEDEPSDNYGDWDYEDFEAFDPWEYGGCDDLYHRESDPEPVVVAYHQLNEPVYAEGESLGEILERMMKK